MKLVQHLDWKRLDDLRQKTGSTFGKTYWFGLEFNRGIVFLWTFMGFGLVIYDRADKRGHSRIKVRKTWKGKTVASIDRGWLVGFFRFIPDRSCASV